MSYDIKVVWPPCAACGRTEDVPAGDRWNYTSNMVEAWEHAGADLKRFASKRASECAPILRAAIERMEADPDTYRAMDSPNGWGKYATLVPALKRLLGMFEECPNGVVRVWW